MQLFGEVMFDEKLNVTQYREEYKSEFVFINEFTTVSGENYYSLPWKDSVVTGYRCFETSVRVEILSYIGNKDLTTLELEQPFNVEANSRPVLVYFPEELMVLSFISE
jgi:hypothetical protein